MNTPIKYSVKVKKEEHHIIDTEHQLIAICPSEKDAMAVVKAVNGYDALKASHDKLVEALRENYEYTKYAGANKRINTPEYMEEFFSKGLSAQQIAKQALKEAGEI